MRDWALLLVVILAFLTGCSGGTFDDAKPPKLMLNSGNVISLKHGDTFVFEAYWLHSNGKSEAIDLSDESYAFSVDNVGVAHFSGQKNALQANKDGVAVVWLTYKNASTNETQASEKVTVIVQSKALSRLEFTKAHDSIPKGVTAEFFLDAVYSDGSRQDVTSSAIWSTSDGNVMTVVRGRVTASSSPDLAEKQSVDVTASFNGLTVSKSVMVSDAVISSIVISSPVVTIPQGVTQTLHLVARYSDNTALVQTASANWRSSAPQTVEVTSGVVSGLAQGEAIITATLEGKIATAQVFVREKLLHHLEIVVPPQVSVQTPTDISVMAFFEGYNGGIDVTSDVIWALDNAKATIDDGTLLGVGLGPVAIKAVYGDKEALSTVEIVDPVIALEVKMASEPHRVGDDADFTVETLTKLGQRTDVSNDPNLSVVSYDAGALSWQRGNRLKVVGMGPGAFTVRLGALETNAQVKIGSLSKSGYWYGVDSYLSHNTALPVAEAHCSGCSHQRFSYQWIVDMDEDGHFDMGPAVADRVYDSDSYAPVNDEFGKPVRLIANHEEWETPLMNDYLANALVRDLRFSGNYQAFAALKQDGTVVTEGEDSVGGNSSAVARQLTDVEQIVSGESAYAVRKGDGTVVAWGNVSDGGDASAVRDQLNDVTDVVYWREKSGFVARKSDGTLATWGAMGASAIQGTNVSHLSYFPGANSGYLVAETAEGASLVWDPNSLATTAINDVSSFHVNNYAFAAVKQDGSVVTGGEAYSGGDASAVQDQLTDVVQILSLGNGFIALKQDGTVVFWGDAFRYDATTALLSSLTNVKRLYNSRNTIAALKHDGTVFTWANTAFGVEAIPNSFVDIEQMVTSAYSNAFAMTNSDGTVVVAEFLGDYNGANVTIKESVFTDNAKHLYSHGSNGGIFIALTSDDTVAVWGRSAYGGDPSNVQHRLTNVLDVIRVGREAYGAWRLDGTLIVWGRGVIEGLFTRGGLHECEEQEVAVK